MNVSIYYHPEAYTTSAPKLMGRHAAGESFLTAFLRHNTNEELWVQVGQESHGRDFEERFAQLIKGRKVHYLTPGLVSVLDSLKACFFPGPGIAKSALQRTLFNDKAWALTGITHTTASAGAMDEITQLVSHPVQTWDALICTSQSVKTHVERLIQQQLDYFSHRFRTPLSQPSLPMLPVIPLGVNCDDFTTNDDTSRQARSVLGVGAAELVVLFVGRLSFHAKAHPLAMYQALQKASERTSKKVRLIECGWFANDYIEKAFDEAAHQACPLVNRLVLDGRDPSKRRLAWSAADVFCSLSDNIQETFGITPIEAMARGIPVVVSDWDGYRETIRHGVDGFRVPTVSAPAGLGQDLARRHALEIDNYDMYCGYSSSLVAMDIEAAAQQFTQLLQSEDLRKSMGRSGQERAQHVYDWSVVLKEYEALWTEQDARRRAAEKPSALPVPWPSRADPFLHFSHYATVALGAEDRLVIHPDINRENLEEGLSRRIDLAMVKYSQAVMLPAPELQQLLKAIGASGSVVVKDILATIAQEASPLRTAAYRSLCWLLKLGLLQRVTDEGLKPREAAESFGSNIGLSSQSTVDITTLCIAGLGIAKKAGVTEARVDYPLTALGQQPHVKVVFGEKSLQLPAGFGPGILLLHRQFLNDRASQTQMEKFASKGWLLVSDMDDDPHHWPEYVSSDFYAFLGVHAVTVSTQPLADMMRQWNPNVLVFPNQLLAMPSLPAYKLQSSYPQGRPVRVFFGALNRWDDWQAICGDLVKAAKALSKGLEFVVVHDQKVCQSLPQELIKTFHPTLNHAQYMAVLSECDISLLPLRDTPFNRLKSDLKLIESAGCGAVPIFSPTVYAANTHHASVGVMANKATDWAKALRMLVAKPDELLKRRVLGLQYVQGNRLYSQVTQNRERCLRDLWAKKNQLELERKERVARWIAKSA